MANPKVSIVIPVYNVEKYLKQCLDSAVNQTLLEIEIICVDDGSTDNSGSILDEYAQRDSRIKVIHKENAGYGKAMNDGLAKATGEYFAVLESDDFIVKDAYEILYREAKLHDADIVRSDYFDYSTNGNRNILKVKQMTSDYSYYNRLICPNEEKIVYTFVMHNWTGIYRISYLREKNIRYNETPGASYQDNGFFFQTFSQTKKLVYIPKPFYCYRIDNPNSSINSKAKVYTMAGEYQFIRDFLTQHQEFCDELLPVYYARLFRAYHQTYMRISSEFKEEFACFFHEKFIEARDMHQIDSSLYSEKQRRLLEALLASPEQYRKHISRSRTPILSKEMLKKVIRVVKSDGLDGFFVKAKKRLLE